MNGAARAGHGDKLLAGATDEFALGIARWLAECVEARRASKAWWTGRARRAGWADAAACTVRATSARRTWRTGYAGGTWRALSLRSGRTRWTGWSSRPLCPLRTLKAAGQREADDQCNNHDGQAHRFFLRGSHRRLLIALGFKRYGFDAEAAQIAHDISKAASHFLLNQLPEVYTAFRRDAQQTFRRSQKIPGSVECD